LACVIGLERTFRFFFQKHKIKASIAFFGGISVVLLGWPLFGMLIETYGFVLLFRYVVPLFLRYISVIPEYHKILYTVLEMEV
jgi:hypothetical protein